ncbi:hypothetical protein UFOVP1533_49 [uncultured Caudovirales phage]|uniref:Uncharacterized protein n=1 Tax=uncultured Caudovirales phage TaxID=2100421 RepID=A0A6J5SGE0_9CAUD|nr:hypothetical protein UFOVP1086_49 [uncultured Caudovirales phage]CAB4213004.1 hypothetical protein UFOVP1440_49 [uncultured Caudovirales phage]CAB5228364.1 hypothetical protein UFOVP1533_49 [uncultured Caudovirales phage]
MPDPNSHAGLTPLVKHEPMPSLWWLTPWTFAVQQWNARAKLYAQCQDLRDDLATARQDAANFSDHAVYHEQRHADQSHEVNALHQTLNDYRMNQTLNGCRTKTYVYKRPVIKAKRKPAPKAKAKAAKKAKR